LRRPEDVLKRMTEHDDGSGRIGDREIGEGPYEGEGKQKR
jgi:hypothetical protein